MDLFDLQHLLLLVPAALSTVTVVILLAVSNFVVRRNQHGELPVSRQLLMLCLTATGILIIIFTLPMSQAGRGQLLSLMGIVVTAVIALSSTTFVGNVMAGLMLRAVNSFRPGDFIRSGDCFGKVTERGIFHTEVQTEDRDLTTLPNMYLVNNPVTVIHVSGTIISANLSLGYDVSHLLVEELLKRAAEETGLDDAFVLVRELGDFSVSYRVGGFSDEVNRLLTIKSNLRRNILNVLHENRIEIVSPNFMNQRVLAPGERMIPGRYRERINPEEGDSPEAVIFEKADEAAEREARKEALVRLHEQLAELEDARKSAPEAEAPELDRQRQDLKAQIETLAKLIEAST